MHTLSLLTSNCIILEEAAYIDEEQYKTIILPHKGNDYTTTVAITTPGNDTNWFSYLEDLRDAEGELIYWTFRPSTACLRCRLEKKTADCSHVALNSWKTQRGIDQVRAILQNDEATFNREMKGVVTVDQTRIYSQFVKPLFELPRYVFKTALPLIITGVDPAGGGTSDSCIEGLGIEDGKYVLIGGETLNTREYSDVDKMYVNYALGIREQPFYSKSVMLVGIEANFGGWPAANRIADLFQPAPGNFDALMRHKQLTNGKSLEPVYFMSKDPKGGKDRGLFTSNEQLEGGARLLRDVLEAGQLRIASKFVSKNQDQFLAKLKKQLQNFREEIKEPADPIHGEPKRKLTGKSGGKQDDIVVTLMLMLFWFNVIKRTESFRNYCKSRGIPVY